jgi:uncharacterized protein (TIGR02145 family)
LCYNRLKLTHNARGGRSESSIKQFRRRGGAALKCLIALALIVATATSVKVLADVIASFTVAEPDKTVNVIRGNSVDDTSTVNVSDPDATDGYIIKAKLSADIAADFTVQIWSEDSTACTEASKCTLTTDYKGIYANLTDSATQEPADEITFNVRIISAYNTTIATHDVYIDYGKERIPLFMQDFSADVCAVTTPYATDNTEFNLRDDRDNKVYKVRKLADGNCWMVDNLALDGPRTLTNADSDIDSGTYALGAVATPNGQTYCANLDPVIYPHKCGNHYAWTVATAESSGNPATSSICPKNWRLPVNTEYTTLQTDLGWGNIGNNVVDSDWRGLYAGYGTSSRVSTYGYSWSATSGGGTNASALVFVKDGAVNTSSVLKSDTRSVRCLAK